VTGTNVIELDNVSKWFRRHMGPKLVRDHIRDLFRTPADQRFYAVRNVSFNVARGERVALVGRNGAGKSTLLSLIAGLATPDSGAIRVNGRIAALMELGAGFHYDLTGTENVLLNASLLGLSRKRARELYPAIVEFSGIGEFIHEPLRTYSSGMVMRLAFSVASHVEADILIVDEVIAVGDQQFHEKCIEKLREQHREGRTLLFVSHSPGVVLEFCDRAIWLDHGEVMADGPASQVLSVYSGHSAGV